MFLHWHERLDYVYFIYGISFLLLGIVSLSIHKRGKAELDWRMLAAFGFLHGMREISDMIAWNLGDNSPFQLFRSGLLAISFLSLLEFGRASLNGRSLVPGRWIHLVLTGGALLVPLDNAGSLDAGIRYFLCIPAALIAGMGFLRQTRLAEFRDHRSLFFIGLAMFGYALGAGVIGPKTSYFPGSHLNDQSFTLVMGIPIQIFRAALSILMCASLWNYQHNTEGVLLNEREKRQ
ncbi:MAG TPA: hypothetical protein PKM25_13115, partial [Candidatus Ozemobacteraceae bacterium]|nr:hypothetical protein [Candidatus Ozemobacteraceae bacterium]